MRLSAIAIAAIICTFSGQIQASKYATLGVGDNSCGSYVEAANAGNASIYLTWLTGFLTGVNRWSRIKDITKDTDIVGASLWIQTYCKQNPLDKFAGAAEELVFQLNGQKDPSKP